MSPLPGSPLRSHHGTLQLPPHLTQHLWELSSCLASFWSFPHLPQVSVLLPLVPLTLCWVSRLLFSLLVPLSLSSRPLLMLVPASVVSSPLTSWHIHSSPQGPAPKSATCPISPHLPSRHQQALGALVPLKCIQLCLFSALGLSPSPQRRDLSCTPSVGPVGCEQGRLSLGLGGHTWTLPCGTATWHCHMPGAEPGISPHSSRSPLSTQEAELGQACFRGSQSCPDCPGPRLPAWSQSPNLE